MSCKQNDALDCCGTLVYLQECNKCRTAARFWMLLVRIFHKEDAVKFRGMTREERAQYRRPIFEGDQGDIVVGLWPIAKRLLLELTHAQRHMNRGLVIHGTRRVSELDLRQYQSGRGITNGAHCWICECKFGKCCKFCRVFRASLLDAPEAQDTRDQQVIASLDRLADALPVRRGGDESWKQVTEMATRQERAYLLLLEARNTLAGPKAQAKPNVPSEVPKKDPRDWRSAQDVSPGPPALGGRR